MVDVAIATNIRYKLVDKIMIMYQGILKPNMSKSDRTWKSYKMN